jgi:integrase
LFLKDPIHDIKQFFATDADIPPMFFGAATQDAKATTTPLITIDTSIGVEPLQQSRESCTLGSQAKRWLFLLRNSRRKARAPSTLATFESGLRTIFKYLDADTRLAEFTNASMKDFIARVSAPQIVTRGSEIRRKQLKPASVQQLGLIVRLVIASARDKNGDRLFNPQWDSEFIDAPRVEPSKQKTPCLSREQVEALIAGAASDQERLLYIVLCATGLRISEAQAMRVKATGEHTSWSSGKIEVQASCFRNEEIARVKTAAANRTVHIHSSVNAIITNFVIKHDRQPGSYLFEDRNGNPVPLSTVRDRMAQIVPGAAPHAARRFRLTFMRDSRVQEDVIRKEMGHADETISDRYSKQSEETCAAAVEACGIGFQIGENSYG